MLERSAISLDGRAAVVTGGGAGIGRAIAETLAVHGAAVLVAERDEARAAEVVAAIRGRGGRAEAAVVDVQERGPVQAMAEQALSAFGRVDVLVNNVGHFLRPRLFVESDEADWEALYRINLKHVLLCTRALAPAMIEGGAGGSIITLSSIEGFRGIPANAVYAAFKSAISGFTKSLALELARHRIRVNAIAPETTETPQVPISRWIAPEHRERIPTWIPLGRFGTPDDAAGCALFLASDLSAWVTGTTIHLDGGALAAGGFYRVPGAGWTNLPLVEGSGIRRSRS